MFGRRSAAVGVVAALLLALNAVPAAAFSPGPVVPVDTVGAGVSSADEAAMPAGLIVDLLGNVLPQSRANEAISYALDNYASHGGIASDLVQGYQMAQHVPGFRLGTKIGGWIDQAMGIGPGPVPGFVPYSGVENSAGWDNTTVTLENPTMTVSGIGWSSSYDQPPAYGGTAMTGTAAVAYVFGQLAVPGPANSYPGAYYIAKCVDGAVWGEGTVNWSLDASGANQAYYNSNPGVIGRLSGSGGGSESVCAGADPNTGASYGGFAGMKLYGLAAPGTASSPDMNDLLSTYTPSGSTAPVTGGATNDREWDLATTCADGFVNHQYSATFKETDNPFPPVPSPWDCGSHGLVTSWVLQLDNASGLKVMTIESWAVPSAVSQLTTTYPACAGTQCTVVLWKVNGTAYEDCFASQSLCDGWSTDTNRATDYACTYGPQGLAYGASGVTDIGLPGCYMYGPTFSPSQRAAGVIYSDPSVDPATPGTKVNQPAPVATPGGPSTASTACFPSGWAAFNPFEWVLKPVECALVWAFEPDPNAVATALNQAWTTIEVKPPISLVVAVYPVVSGFTSAVLNGCTTYLADFGDGLQIPCAPPGDPAWFQAFYFISEVFIAGWTAFGLWRMVEDGLKDG